MQLRGDPLALVFYCALTLVPGTRRVPRGAARGCSRPSRKSFSFLSQEAAQEATRKAAVEAAAEAAVEAAAEAAVKAPQEALQEARQATLQKARQNRQQLVASAQVSGSASPMAAWA